MKRNACFAGMRAVTFVVLLLSIVAFGKDIQATQLKANGLCLDASQPFKEGSFLHMWPCEEANPKELWNFDAASRQIKHNYGGLCLFADAVGKFSFVKLAQCDTSQDGQLWEHDPATGKTASVATGLCLDSAQESQGKVHAESCDDSRESQRWEMKSEQRTHCELTVWSEFTKCTAKCGKGLQKRVRAVIEKPDDGTLCGHLVETRMCNTAPCTKDKECKVGSWGNWTTCTHKCGGGQQVRSRDVIVQATRSDFGCPALQEERECNTHGCPIEYEEESFVSANKVNQANMVNTAVPASHVISSNTTKLTPEEKEMLQACEHLSPAMAQLTLDKEQVELHLAEARKTTEALQAKLTQQTENIKIANAVNTNLTEKIHQQQLMIDRLRLSAEDDENIESADTENGRLVSELESAEVNRTQLIMAKKKLKKCHKEKAALNLQLDNSDDEVSIMQAQLSEQTVALANSTLKQSILAAARESAKSDLAAARIREKVDKQTLTECRTERDEVAIKLYKAENDVLTANMTHTKQQEMLDSCVESKSTLSGQLRVAEEAAATLTAEKKELSQLLSNCTTQQTTTEPLLNLGSVLDDAKSAVPPQ